jgi:acyl-coenzyme A synthetase/AMP-(fatty) acid ligase
VATAGDLRPDQHEVLGRVRLLLSAGAPVGTGLLSAAAALLPAATARTPYGMTEVLPVTDASLADLLDAGPGDGVLVGAPVPGAQVAVSPLDAAGAATGALTDEPGVTGEVAVRAPHVKERYDQLWDTQRASARDAGWHRTGDVGHLSPDGRLWIEGRLAHVLTTPGGVVTPVGPEQRVQALDAVARAALVGVGPAGTQQAVVVLEASSTPAGAALRPGPAPLHLLDAVREAVRQAAGVSVAAVLVVAALPTDVRHRSKVDRTRVAAWAEQVLAGRARAGSAP